MGSNRTSSAASANLNEDGLGRGLPRAADTGASGPAPSPDEASAETSRDVAWSHPSRGITGDLGGPLPKPSSAAQGQHSDPFAKGGDRHWLWWANASYLRPGLYLRHRRVLRVSMWLLRPRFSWRTRGYGKRWT